VHVTQLACRVEISIVIHNSSITVWGIMSEDYSTFSRRFCANPICLGPGNTWTGRWFKSEIPCIANTFLLPLCLDHHPTVIVVTSQVHVNIIFYRCLIWLMTFKIVVVGHWLKLMSGMAYKPLIAGMFKEIKLFNFFGYMFA